MNNQLPITEPPPPGTLPPDISMIDSSTAKTPVQKMVRAFLQKFLQDTYRLPYLILPDAELPGHRVCVMGLDIDGEDLFKPKFFDPLPNDALPEPTPEYVTREFSILGLSQDQPVEFKFPVWNYLEAYLKALLYLDLPDGQLPFAFMPNDDLRVQDLWDQVNFDYGPYWVTHIEDNSQPHIKCIFWTNEPMPSQYELTRTEMILLAKLQLYKLQERRLRGDAIIPVLAIILNGSRVRIIESNCESYGILVRRTRQYYFPRDDYGTFKLIARWFFSNPVGDTSLDAWRRIDRPKHDILRNATLNVTHGL